MIRDKLAVIIVNYGSPELLKQNIAANDPRPVADHVIIVDNFLSTEHTSELSELCEWMGWELVCLEKNTGFGHAVNRGVERAQELACTVFLFQNPDARIEQNAVAELFDSCVSAPMTALSPRIVRDDESAWFSGAQLDVSTGFTMTGKGASSSSETGWLTGACLMIHLNLWRQVKGFDDDYFLYWEDIDFSWRCHKIGAHLNVRHDIIAHHSVGASQQSTGKSPAYVYFNCRNRLLFATKHVEKRTQISWMFRSPLYAKRVLFRGGRKQFARNCLPLLSAAVRGTASGSFSVIRNSVWSKNAA